MGCKKVQLGFKKPKTSASAPLFQNYGALTAKRRFLCPKAHIFPEILAALGSERGKMSPCAPEPTYPLRFSLEVISLQSYSLS